MVGNVLVLLQEVQRVLRDLMNGYGDEPVNGCNKDFYFFLFLCLLIFGFCLISVL
ncbi:hypothetical protein Hanom_Chr17g01570471 [Helianthus anomalus]